MQENYRLRGSRVQPLPLGKISNVANNVGRLFNLNQRNKRNFDHVFESLYELGVILNVVDDNEWLFVTKGHCDPSVATISIPQSIYNNACLGERDALAVMLHEMGHLFLAHKPVLHYSQELLTQEEDSEWQADCFADVILKNMGYQTEQLSFDFYT
ncbi:ImmA/IrrE family metallo-endopeptidase [Vibrio sp. OPT18]|uniref:ImmA/IrrE family metallo-endopeptidase n=1 Tax=Vibrio sp. OPT18 TaxID=2778641 RepID=UPI00187ED52C|nr:toxin [Vibrio sp. OPT18]MBE8578626.1 toxin [Vibrio sp. OPT18]